MAGYCDAMQDVAVAERVDEWVPATSTGTTSVGGAMMTV